MFVIQMHAFSFFVSYSVHITPYATQMLAKNL